MKTVLILTLLTLPLSALAENSPFSAGDPKIGKALVEKHCISCHAASFGGDGSGIYTRENHLVKTTKGLLQQIRNCNTNLGLKWFEDDEQHVASYLNQSYYRFK